MTEVVAIRASFAWGGAAGDWPDACPEAVRARAERIDRFGQLALGAVGGVLGTPFEAAPRRDVGIVVGTAFGCIATNAAYQHRLAAHGAGGASPRLFAATVSNAAAGEVGIAYGIGGPTLTVTAGLVSGLAALDVARDELLLGGVPGMVVIALDALGADGERWIAASGWSDSEGSEGALAVALGDVPGGGDVSAWLGGVATGWAEAHEGLYAVAASAAAQSGRALGELRVVTCRPGDETVVGPALGRPVEALAVVGGAVLAARGLAVLLQVVCSSEDAVLVVDRCPSGQVAAAVAWKA